LIEAEPPFINLGYVASADSADGKTVARGRYIESMARMLRAEHGFAVPTALFMVLAAFAVVSVGVVASVQVQRGNVRDQGTKSAVQVAESAVNEALLHFNRIPPGNAPCSPVSTSGPGVGGWCPAVSGTFNGAPYTYQVRPYVQSGGVNDGMFVLDVVGTSTVAGASRRVFERGYALSEENPFGTYQVKAGDWIHMDSNAEVRAGTATNGDITMNSNARQCGQASVGIGKQMQTSSNAGYYTDPTCSTPNPTLNHEDLVLPPVNQGDVATNNNNSYFFTTNRVTSGQTSKVCWNGIKADGSAGTCGARHLALSENTAVTLVSGNYSFCKLTMDSNTALYVAGGNAVTIYFDSPEACGYSSGVTQLDMNSNARISPTAGTAADVKLLFVGSTHEPPWQTQVHMSSNTYIPAACEQNFVLYAPLSDITLNSNSTYCGGVAGKTLFLDSNARLWIPPTGVDFPWPVTAPHYVFDRFIECTSAPQTTPDAGC
jgi:hypothetical protein